MNRTVSQLLILLLLLLGGAQQILAEEPPLEPSTINTRYMLMDHFGKVITDMEFRGKYQLITFGYTHCPDVCPMGLAVMSAALKVLGKEADKIQPLFISIDPDRDTPRILYDYVTYFHPNLIGLTGTHVVIKRTASNFKVRFEKVVNEGDDADKYWMDHTASTYLIGPQGEFLAKFAYGISAETLVEKIRQYL